MSLAGMINQAATLQQQMAQLIDLQTQILQSLESLDVTSSQSVDVPEEQIIPIFLQSDGLRTSQSDPRQLHIIRAIACTDTAGRFSLSIGRNDTAFKFRLSANTPYDVVTPSTPIIVPKGLEITLTPGTGSPAWELALFCIAGSVQGQVDARQ